MRDFIKDANSEQQEAITHGDGPLLIVAGAGTGKTMVITNRIAYLILKEKAKVHELLALTFTEKAAGEMIERVDKLLPYGYVDLWISTFHSFADKILKRHALDIGLSNDYKLLDTTQAWLLVRKNLDKFNLDYYRPLGSPTRFIHALINHFSRCKDEGIQPSEYLKYAEEVKLNTDSSDFVKKLEIEDLDEADKKEFIKSEILRLEEVANAYHVYQQLLIDNNCLDFGDLINYCIKLFKERPLILQKYRKQFKYILVDEFQDTNLVQYELIKLLAAPNNNLTVVGDDDQSIFKFRGASISNIMKFMEDYPQAKQIVLIKNYRSSKEILDKAYDFIRLNDPERLEVKLKINKKLHSQINQKGIVEHQHFDHVDVETMWVVKKIVELRSKDKETDWSDFAILVRANDSAKPFINLFEQYKIPYQFMSLRGLYNKPVILDLINYFKLLDNYHENSAVLRVLNFPFLNISQFEIAKITHFARKKIISLFEAVKQVNAIVEVAPEVKNTLNKLIVQIEKDTSYIKKNRITSLVVKFFHESGYNEYIKNLGEPKSIEEFGYVEQFIRKIQDFETNEIDPSLSNFLQLLDYELESGDSGSIKIDEVDKETVKILSVHSAKGLEFRYVFVVNLVERKFPSDEKKEPIEIPVSLIKEKLPEGDFHLAEERRLFYVAMTRAKLGLFFTSADNYGGTRVKKLSRFLTELGYSKPDKIVVSDNKIETSLDLEVKLEKKVENLPLPKVYSFSSLSNYEICPYKFYLANILKIQTERKPATIFGDIIHRTLKDFVEQNCRLAKIDQVDLFGLKTSKEQRILTWEELSNIYEKNWTNDGFGVAKIAKEYQKKGLKLLKEFYQDFVANKPDIYLIEQQFSYFLKEYKITGRIDRIDRIPEGFEIIDYKTGQVKSDKLEQKDKTQLILYQLASERLLNLKPIKLTYFYLEDGKRVSFTPKLKEIDKTKEKLLDYISKINKREFTANPNEYSCKNCDFYCMCEFRKI